MRALVAAVVAFASLLLGEASGAGECSSAANKALYDDALARIASCETSVGFELVAPLSAARTKTICSTCTALVAATKTKSFGDCTVEGSSAGKTTTLQAKLEALFVCTADVSPSQSSSGSSDIETPAPTTTVTPTPSKTNATSPSSPSSGSGGSLVPSPGSSLVPSPTKKTPAPTTTADESASGSKSASSKNGSMKAEGSAKSSGSTGGQISGTTTEKGSITGIGLVVGIAAGVVVLVILVATFIVCRQRRKSQRQSREADDFIPTSADTPGISGRGGGSSGSSLKKAYSGSTASSAPRGSFQYMNDTFLLPSQSGGLWEDEAIVAVRIPREKVISEVLISRGGYGEVYRGVYNGHSVAIKTLLPEKRKSMKQINAFLAEVKLMASLEHEQIVRFVGVAWDSLTDLCVVSEYMEGGDLRAVLTRFEEKEYRPHGFDHDKVKIALHISHALTYLHSLQPIVLHRDLKSKNILLDKQLNAKLTDFGVSRERSDRTMTAGVGSSLWMAPEVMLGERYDEKSDIFSFGVVLSELDSQVMPYSHLTESSSGRRIPDTAILQMVSLGRLRVQFSRDALPEMVAIANACVSLDPQERPSAADVLYQLHNVLKSL